MFLLDTNVVSETRRPKPHGAVMAWLSALGEHDASICAATIGEIQAGIEKARRHDPVRAAELDTWLTGIEASYAVLPVDSAAFRTWGRLMHGKPSNIAMDAMIASVALTHGLILATRNIRDFEGFGVKVVNPFSA